MQQNAECHSAERRYVTKNVSRKQSLLKLIFMLVELLWGYTSRNDNFGRVVRQRYLPMTYLSVRPSRLCAASNRFKISKHIWTIRCSDGSSFLPPNFVIVNLGVYPRSAVLKIVPSVDSKLNLRFCVFLGPHHFLLVWSQSNPTSKSSVISDVTWMLSVCTRCIKTRNYYYDRYDRFLLEMRRHDFISNAPDSAHSFEHRDTQLSETIGLLSSGTRYHWLKRCTLLKNWLPF